MTTALLPAQHDGARVEPLTQDSVRFSVAIASLGLGLQHDGGTLSSVALLCLTVTLAESWLIFGWPNRDTDPRNAWIVSSCVAVSTALLLFDNHREQMTIADRRVYALLVAAGLVIAVLLSIARMTHRRVLFGLLLITIGAVGLWLLASVPPPGIDVLLFQKEAVPALLQGRNPYAMQFRDLYPPDASAFFYGPGVSIDGVLQFGYPYMPLTLLAAIPGSLCGDVRYTSLAAMLASALLIVLARPTRASYLAATMLLTTPAFPLMLVNGWVESYVVLLFAAVWFVGCRAPALLPYVVGLLFASKQYMIIVVPGLLLLLPRPWAFRTSSRFMLKAVVTGVAVTAPLALWSPPAFLNSAAFLQFRQPFRPDALSYLAWLAPEEPLRWVWIAFAASAIAWAMILTRAPRRAVSFSLSCALVFIVFFALNKQAFLNYYYVVLGCLSCAMAESRLAASTPHSDRISHRDAT